jgi:hypothetical protein
VAGSPGRTPEDVVSEFGDLEKRRRPTPRSTRSWPARGINEVSGFAERDTDHHLDEQIDRAVDVAEQHIGLGQDQHGNQN